MIQKKFSEIVGINIVTIVVTVGVEIDSEWMQYVNEPTSYGRFPPKKVCFTGEQGQKLKSVNVRWTLKLVKVECEVESEVVTKLKDRQPFVFCRSGSVSRVFTETREALDVVFNETHRFHYLLIVGDDNGIEEEIQQDIKIVASLADLKDDDFRYLCESLKESDFKFGNYYGKDGVFTILIAPEVDELKKRLHKKLLCSGHTLTIVYSGHANSNGDWEFSDGSFSADDLKLVVNCAKGHIQHYINIKIILNCCYGLVFAEKLGKIEAFLGGLTMYQNDDGNEYTAEQIKDYAFSKLIDCTKESIELNHFIVEKIARRMYDRTNCLITMQDTGKASISILPYTVGPLVAQGVLYNSLEMPYAQLHDLDIFKIRKKTIVTSRCSYRGK